MSGVSAKSGVTTVTLLARFAFNNSDTTRGLGVPRLALGVQLALSGIVATQGQPNKDTIILVG